MRTLLLMIPFVVVFFACNGEKFLDNPCGEGAEWNLETMECTEVDSCVDADGDGVCTTSDCNDTEAAIYPDATEICDGLDNDCDRLLDENDECVDEDSDGYPSDVDCNDGDAAIYPDADEVCDSLDNDCDGSVDEEAVDQSSWYQDLDADGYGSTKTVLACEEPDGYSAYGGDCNDLDTSYNPGAEESDCADPSDYNCDGSVGYTDFDLDGYPACEECNDSEASVNPSGTEVCNSLDDDCDGVVDNAAVDATIWYRDSDADGYGDVNTTVVACAAPDGYVANDSDCDDAISTRYPGATETCDGIDNDCDGNIDDNATDASTWYRDVDGDGFGDNTDTMESCEQPEGYVSKDTDCNDENANVNTGVTEVCNGIDDNCDGTIDEGSSETTTWYRDSDNDGFGNASVTQTVCDQPSGYVADDSDCNDTEAAIYPGATETCDGIDNDCDGNIDDDPVDSLTWYEDEDDDGYGDPASSSVESCEDVEGYVTNDNDCNDDDPGVNPAAIDGAGACNGVDDDCDGTIDEGC